MKGFHVEEPSLLHLDLTPLDPVRNLVGHEHTMLSPHLKHENISLDEFGGKPHHTHIPSSSQSFNKASAEERDIHRWPECNYGGLLCNLAEINNWGMDKMVVPVAEKKKQYDEYVCRGMPHMGTMDRHDQSEEGVGSISRGTPTAAYVGGTNGFVGNQEDHHICHAQASIAASINGVKVDHLLGFKGFLNNDADHLSIYQDSIAASTKGNDYVGRFLEHMGNIGNYGDDLQASMAAVTCESPPGDNPFWRLLPSNNEKHSMDLTSSDEFCMYEFKVRRCMRGRSHDWTECPFAHPGEKARRRDPRFFNYSGMACPDFRRGTCRRGDSCELSHGVFECWLHPARYRTQLCKDGRACKRRVCFFAHSPSQLRLISPGKVLNHDDFPRASSKDARAGYFDATLKEPPFFTKQASNGTINGYSGDGFFDDFSPKSMSSFPTDGLQHGIPMSAHIHSLKSSPLERDMENYTKKNSYGHQGMSSEYLSEQFELFNNGDHSHGYFPVTNGLLLVDDHGNGSSNGHSYCHTSSSLDNPSLKAEANFRSQLALASLKGSLDQRMSPTSTLAGHVFSPPPLSPPLSPAESPPMSPGVALSTWSTALARKIAPLASHPRPYDAFSQSPSSGLEGTHVTLLSNLANSNHGSSVHTSTHGPSPLSAPSNEDTLRDMDRSHSRQSAINIKDESVQTASTEMNPPTHAMTQFILMLQQMEIRRATVDMKSRKRSPSLLQRMQSPKSILEAGHGGECWGGGHGLSAHGRGESWEGLKGKMHANFAKEEIENPDLGWVNELVK